MTREKRQNSGEIAKNTKQDPLQNFLYSDHSLARQRAKNLNREIAYNYANRDLSDMKVGTEEYMNVVGVYLGLRPRSAATASLAGGPGVTPLATAKTGRAVSAPASPDKLWPSFWAKFRAAVNSRSKVRLKLLMAPESEFSSGGGGESRDEWLTLVSEQKWWPLLQLGCTRRKEL